MAQFPHALLSSSVGRYLHISELVAAVVLAVFFEPSLDVWRFQDSGEYLQESPFSMARVTEFFSVLSNHIFQLSCLHRMQELLHHLWTCAYLHDLVPVLVDLYNSERYHA